MASANNLHFFQFLLLRGEIWEKSHFKQNYDTVFELITLNLFVIFISGSVFHFFVNFKTFHVYCFYSVVEFDFGLFCASFFLTFSTFWCSLYDFNFAGYILEPFVWCSTFFSKQWALKLQIISSIYLVQWVIWRRKAAMGNDYFWWRWISAACPLITYCKNWNLQKNKLRNIIFQ